MRSRTDSASDGKTHLRQLAIKVGESITGIITAEDYQLLMAAIGGRCTRHEHARLRQLAKQVGVAASIDAGSND